MCGVGVFGVVFVRTVACLTGGSFVGTRTMEYKELHHEEVGAQVPQRRMNGWRRVGAFLAGAAVATMVVTCGHRAMRGGHEEEVHKRPAGDSGIAPDALGNDMRYPTEPLMTEDWSKCKVLFDGCNTCRRSQPGGPLACTRMLCRKFGDVEKKECRAWFSDDEPTLLVKAARKPTIDYVVEPAPQQAAENEQGPSIFPRRPIVDAKPPAGCKFWFDGCNKCRIMSGGRLACTKMACGERKEPKCLAWEEPEPTIPAGCKVWFDGCNTCNQGGACTEMYCVEREEPKCLEWA